MDGRNDAQQHAHSSAKQRAADSERQRLGEALRQFLHDGLAGENRRAQIAVQRIAHEAEILDIQRVVQTQTFTFIFLGVLRNIHAQHHVHRVARNQPHHHEHNQRQNEQHGYHLQNPLNNVFPHGTSPLLLYYIKPWFLLFGWMIPFCLILLVALYRRSFGMFSFWEARRKVGKPSAAPDSIPVGITHGSAREPDPWCWRSSQQSPQSCRTARTHSCAGSCKRRRDLHTW